jgi:hypothetical protein
MIVAMMMMIMRIMMEVAETNLASCPTFSYPVGHIADRNPSPAPA